METKCLCPQTKVIILNKLLDSGSYYYQFKCTLCNRTWWDYDNDE